MKLFKRKKTIDDVFDSEKGLLVKFGGFVNDLKLTDEEVIKHNAKVITDVQKFVKDTMDESLGRSKSRRTLAEVWYALQITTIIVIVIAAPFDMELAEFYFGLASSTIMFSVTTAITIFFFGSHGVSKFQDRQNNKKDQ